MARNCYECKEKTRAYSLCTYCNRWLCCSCTEEHRHGKETSNHFLSVAQMNSSGSESVSNRFCMFCPLHSQEVLKLFCETCDVLTCRNCLILEHKEHRFRHIDEALQGQRGLLENITSQAEEKKIGMQAAAKQLGERLLEIKHTQRKMENQIKMAKMVLINELNKRTNALLEQLERLMSERRHMLEQQLQAIILLNRQLEHVQNFISWAVCRKTNLPFLYSKELIVYQMQRLLETNCNTDVSPPWKIRFNWEPSLWSKQLSHFGSIVTENGQIPHAEVSSYGNSQEKHGSYYRGHHPPPPPTSQLESNHTSPKFQPHVQCPTPVCCSHCHTNTPQMKKSPLTHHSMSHHHNYRQTAGVQQQQHQSMHYNTHHGVKQQRCMPHPMRVVQPWLAQPSQPEQDHSSVWLGKQQMQRQQMQQTTYPVCIVPPQHIQPAQMGHAQLMHIQSSMEAPSVQMELGHPQKLNVNHLQMQQHQHQQHQQQHQYQYQQQQQQQTSLQSESSHEQVMQQSLDIMHQQFELEQMQKGLELLLQSQPQGMQVNPSKPPQHVQQTIVGQINYIVRQPAPVQPHSQEEVQQVFDGSTLNEGQPHDIISESSNVISTVSLTQTFGEQETNIPEPVESQVQQFSDNQVSKDYEYQNAKRGLEPDEPLPADMRHLETPRSASANSASFANSSEPESSPARLSRSADPAMQASPCPADAPSPGSPCGAETPPGMVPSCSAAIISAVEGLNAATSESLATSDALLGDAKCKIENDDYSCADGAFGSEAVDATVNAMNELALPMQNILEEPINLSVRKCIQPNFSPPVHVPYIQPSPVKTFKDESDSSYSTDTEVTMESKNTDSTSRVDTKEQKIPYVRVERLKICPPDTGELPVFKVQPQKSEQEGSIMLRIEYGAQSTCMSIKAHPENNSSSSPSPSPLPTTLLKLATAPFMPNIKPEETEEANTPTELPQAPSFQAAGDTRQANSLPNIKKFHFNEETNTIENEDFCAVCLNGGEMLCCDHCPKVFHLSCHVPSLLSFPVGEWVCTLCRNMMNPEVEYDCDNARYSHDNADKVGQRGLNVYDQRKCEKLVLSLYCSSLSLPFQEPVSPLARHYYQIIKKPIDLSIIRGKLQKMNTPHYTTVEELVFDVRLMFWNCAKFNYPDSEVAEAGRNLQMFFEEKLSEVYPDKIFSLPLQEDSDSEDLGGGQSSLYTRGFHWPPFEHESTHPKKRRRHTVGYRVKESDVRQ